MLSRLFLIFLIRASIKKQFAAPDATLFKEPIDALEAAAGAKSPRQSTGTAGKASETADLLVAMKAWTTQYAESASRLLAKYIKGDPPLLNVPFSAISRVLPLEAKAPIGMF